MESDPQYGGGAASYQQQFIPEMGRMGSAGYSAEHYKFLNELIESKSAREFYIQIANTDFSAQCINAFFKILTSGFDKNAILAKNTPDQIKMRLVDYQIALNMMVIECHESDVQNPAFLTFRENIMQTFRDFISRSTTERDQLLRQEYGIQASDQKQQQPQGTPTLSRFGRQ